MIFDSELAVLDGTEAKALNRAVRRNSNSLPSDFVFELAQNEDLFILINQSQLKLRCSKIKMLFYNSLQ